jgi:hypothetical protein
MNRREASSSIAPPTVTLILLICDFDQSVGQLPTARLKTIVPHLPARVKNTGDKIAGATGVAVKLDAGQKPGGSAEALTPQSPFLFLMALYTIWQTIP